MYFANANELANIAREAGAEVLTGALRYPSETSSWQLGDVDLGEHLDRYRDQQLVIIIAAVGPAEPDVVMCGICGFVMDQAGECPRCKLMVEEVAAGLARRQAAAISNEPSPSRSTTATSRISYSTSFGSLGGPGE